MDRNLPLKKKVSLAILGLLLVFSIIPLGFSAPFKYRDNFRPSPTGLDPTITLIRFFNFEWVRLQNQTFYARFNGTNYYLNVTGGSGVSLQLIAWFDNYGTAFTVDRACNITLFTGAWGSPVQVNGATSVYHAGNTTLDLECSPGYVGVHYGTGGTVVLGSPDVRGFHHGWRSFPSGYGFGVSHGGYYQYSFEVRVYCEYGQENVTSVALDLGNNIRLTYQPGAPQLSETVDTYDYIEIASEWYGVNALASWVLYDSTTQYLDIGYHVYFKLLAGNETLPDYWFIDYEPKVTGENGTVTVNYGASSVNVVSEAFFVHLDELAFLQPILIPWNMQYLMIGLGGIFCLIFGVFFGAKKVKEGDIAEGISIGLIITIISIGLIVVWLWR